MRPALSLTHLNYSANEVIFYFSRSSVFKEFSIVNFYRSTTLFFPPNIYCIQGNVNIALNALAVILKKLLTDP